MCATRSPASRHRRPSLGRAEAVRSEVAYVYSRLAAYHTKLRMMKNLRDSLHFCIDGHLELKRKGDEQSNGRVSKAKDINELKDQLAKLKRRTLTEKKKVEQASAGIT
ncbi:hypothetical protein ABZP36_018803 [Zizania latifolia]